MRWIAVALAVASLALAAGTAVGHDSNFERHVNGCVHTHNNGVHVTCNQPGVSCTPNGGGSGVCKEKTGGYWRSCLCVKGNTISTDFMTTAGWHLVDVEPPEIVPGGVNVFVFSDTTAADAMTFLYGDGGTVIDSLAPTGAVGQIMIQWDVGPPPLTGQVVDLVLDFPSFDLFGTPTGVNHWILQPGPPAGVVLDFHGDGNYIMTEVALEILSGNDIFAPRLAWLGFAIREPDRGRWTCLITENEEITGVSPVEGESWGTIKGLYR